MENPRIIQGNLKGRVLKVPQKGTRPFTERVKKTLFDILQGQFEGKKVLDLFAGSGNLGIEAISNGAQYVLFIDNSDEAIAAISHNIRSFQLEHYSTVQKIDYIKFLKQNKESFDIIFIDPPFNLIKRLNLQDFLPLMHQDTLLIFKSNTELLDKDGFKDFEVIDKRKIGINYLYFFKKLKPSTDL